MIFVSGGRTTAVDPGNRLPGHRDEINDQSRPLQPPAGMCHCSLTATVLEAGSDGTLRMEPHGPYCPDIDRPQDSGRELSRVPFAYRVASRQLCFGLTS